MNISEFATIVGLFISVIAVSTGFTMKILKNLSCLREENETKINRVYERFDEYKEFCEEKFVDMKICELLHKQLKDDVAEIKELTKELPQIQAGIRQLLKNNGKK